MWLVACAGARRLGLLDPGRVERSFTLRFKDGQTRRFQAPLTVFEQVSWLIVRSWNKKSPPPFLDLVKIALCVHADSSMPACRFRVEIHFHRSWGLGSGKSEIHRIRKESSAPGPPNHCVTATGRSNRQVHAGAHHGAISATTTPSVTATGRCIGSAHNGAEGGNPDRSRHRQSRGNHEATRGHQRPTESRARVDGAINACRCDSCSRSST